MEYLSGKISEWVQSHPQNGYLIIAGILLFWLFGVIMGWKWTYETNTWKENTLREIFGGKGYRIGVGVLLGVALACVVYLYLK